MSSISLESIFFEKIQQIDLAKKTGFNEYLSPLESNPHNVKEHLQKENEGIIVSTGTERSFFDLALAPPKCQGLVVIDICPKVKAYVDFNTLLLRISKDRLEYAGLSGDIDKRTENLLQRIEKIRERIKTESFRLKDYYIKHFYAFAKIYFGQIKFWRKAIGPLKINLFEKVQYNQDDSLFQKLQGYAQAGNIISVVGDIQELDFLEDVPIEVIDTSNISDYLPLDLKNKNFTLRPPSVIWTDIHNIPTVFHSKKYIPCTDEDRKKFYEQLTKLKSEGSFNEHSRVGDRVRYFCQLKRNDLVALTTETTPLLVEKLIAAAQLFFSLSERELIEKL